MERNVDKIKRLEHELGRWRKKVADTANENEKLREALAQADVGNQETQALVDAVLTAVVLEHGERAMDPDAPEMAVPDGIGEFFVRKIFGAPAGVEAPPTQIDGAAAALDGGPEGFRRPGGGEELRHLPLPPLLFWRFWPLFRLSSRCCRRKTSRLSSLASF